MPFVKKNDVQGSQPSTDARSIFIGRTGELLFFVQNILKPTDPTHNIISISGQGGVGKSTLLARFIDEAHSASFKDYCLTAMVDERQTTPVSIMEKFADQLHITGKFEKILKQYKETLHKLQTERETIQDAILHNSPDFAGAAAESVPIAGPLLREGVKAGTKHLLERYHTDQRRRDAEILEDSVDDLTKAFIEELNHLAETQVMLSIHRVKRLRIILFFDTFEQLAAETISWLLDHFLEAQVSNNVVLVVAGRDPIERTSPDDPKRWLPYCDNGTIYWISLNCFTEDETRMYLIKKGITDTDQMVNIWHLSRGLPLYMGLLTSNPHGGIDPTKGVVVNFLRWIPEKEEIKRQLALDAALFSKPFNQDDLEVFSYVPESERGSLYQWLTEQPFIRNRPQDGRSLYHDVARDLFRRHLYRQSPKHYYAVRHDLAVYYQALLEKSQDEEGQEIWHSEEWLELLLAVIYQWFLLQDPTSHVKAIAFVLNNYDDYIEYADEKQGKETTAMLRNISQGPSTNEISSSARQKATALLYYIERASDKQGKQERLDALNSLLEQVAHEPSVPHELLSVFYQHRGWCYFFLREYQQALADFNHAIELNPKDAVSYKGRGWTYHNMGSGYNWTKFNPGEARQAIEDFNHALKLDPRLLYVHYALGDVYFSLQEYQKALTNYALEIKRAPKSDSGTRAYIYWRRGYTYLWLKDLQRAQADLTQSYELETKRIDSALIAEWVGLCQKAADPNLSGRLEAITTPDLQSYTAYTCRGMGLLLQRHWREALAELEQALLQKLSWGEDASLRGAHFWKGMAYAFLKQDEEAMAAIEKALELELPPILLAPLCWLEQERPDFYGKYVVPLLAKHA